MNKRYKRTELTELNEIIHVQTQHKPWHIISDHKSRVTLNIEYGYAHSKGEENKSPASGNGFKEREEPGAASFVCLMEKPLTSITWTPVWV